MSNRIPKNKLPNEITKGLYNPAYVPREVNLNDFVQEAELPARQQEAKRTVQKRIKAQDPANPNAGIPIPLTEAEAEAADLQIAATLERIKVAREKLLTTRARLEESISATTGGKELGFQVDIKGKKSLQRAIKKLFGKKHDTITFSMYKELLAAKYLLESQEIEDFSKGKLKED